MGGNHEASTAPIPFQWVVMEFSSLPLGVVVLQSSSPLRRWQSLLRLQYLFAIRTHSLLLARKAGAVTACCVPLIDQLSQQHHAIFVDCA